MQLLWRRHAEGTFANGRPCLDPYFGRLQEATLLFVTALEEGEAWLAFGGVEEGYHTYILDAASSSAGKRERVNE